MLRGKEIKKYLEVNFMVFNVFFVGLLPKYRMTLPFRQLRSYHLGS